MRLISLCVLRLLAAVIWLKEPLKNTFQPQTTPMAQREESDLPPDHPCNLNLWSDSSQVGAQNLGRKALATWGLPVTGENATPNFSAAASFIGDAADRFSRLLFLPILPAVAKAANMIMRGFHGGVLQVD